MVPVILLLTNAADRLPSHVIPALQRKGAQCIRFDTEQFPAKDRLTFVCDAPAVERLFAQTSVATFDLSTVTAVWTRRPGRVVPDPRLAPADQEFASRESKHTLEAFFYCLKDRLWVNPYDASRAAEHKLYQLQTARALGLDIPRTLITNDPARVEGFFSSCSNGLIYKTLTPHARRRTGKPYGIFANRVSVSDIAHHAQQVKFAPCIFQEYIDKKLELRITVIGARMFTCALDSQASETAKDDWRRGLIHGHVPYHVSDIPDLLKAQLHRMLHALGLVFGCFDFILTPDGRYVFLEVNPNGQWYWVEQLTGLSLLDAFTDLLIHGCQEPGLAGTT